MPAYTVNEDAVRHAKGDGLASRKRDHVQGEWGGKPFEDKGEILVFEPEREVAYSHYSSMGGKPDTPENYHVVRVTLDERGGTTRVTLRQSNLEGGPTDEDRANREHYEKNWTQMLEGLKQTTER